MFSCVPTFHNYKRQLQTCFGTVYLSVSYYLNYCKPQSLKGY